MEFAPQEFGAALVALSAPVLDAASRAQPGWLLIALVVHSVSILCRVRIWQLLLRAALPQHAVSFRAALGPYLGSVAANVVAPLRGGDAVRIALARRTLPEARSVAVLATLAAEAIPGLIVVPLLCAVALLLGVLPVSPALAAFVMAGGAALAIAAWRVARLVGIRRRDGRL
ncbi:MAG: Lysylphosphatidylglycerol synthase region, partial [Gaiellales bacterium]|nr:Lysylphosphatidylglycerol synthase region [Gaiellales bacterium]